MRMQLLGAVAVGLLIVGSPPEKVAAHGGAKTARVGKIRIVGNIRTPDKVILRALPFKPGDVLTYPDLKTAERNLARLNRFVVNPTVMVIDNGNENRVHDIMIAVVEKDKDRKKKP